LMFCTSPVFAQNSPGAPVIDRTANTDRIRQQDMSRREWQLRNFGNEPNAPKDRRQVEALMAQTEEDFNRILTLHNEIARALTSKNDLDYHFVSEATAEIHKRASRVQSSLALRPSPEETLELEKSAAPKDLPVKEELVKLCHQIRSFVTNPSIENPNTINAEQMAKARKDLETVIQISERIRKDADKLSRK
ncbi:MAG TPA: hypothetical protein VFI71_09720, partial [Pyrinomonadaceae bacterium]|nr:hypothetical protein [Pyrinomonadaceae bacterium]